MLWNLLVIKILFFQNLSTTLKVRPIHIGDPVTTPAASVFSYLVVLFCFLDHVSSSNSLNEDDDLDLASKPRKVVELIEYWNYQSETHWVTTADGYILTVHRIPPKTLAVNVTTNFESDDYDSLSSSNSSNNVRPRPIVFLLHGIFGTSARWTLGPPDKSLAYILANQGFDVWMGNTRGSSYSRNHTRLDPDTDEEFWDFDIGTAAMGDLTAMYGYIYNQTNGTGPYFSICHSMGCAETAAFLSETSHNEVYNNMFEAVFMMAPPIFMGGSHDFVYSFLTGFSNLAERYMGYKEIRKAKDERRWFASYCTKDHVSQGSSSKVAYHFAQLMKAGDAFRKYDYGPEKNSQMYQGSLTPPNFNLSSITTPIYIYYGDGDKLIAKEDVLKLVDVLPSASGNIFEVNYPGWNHNDFVYAIEAKKLVYDNIIDHIRNITLNDYY